MPHGLRIVFPPSITTGRALLALPVCLVVGLWNDGIVAEPEREIPAKLIVLTFDDGARTQLTVAAPILKELGFGATFFITAKWMYDTENFLSWKEAAELHRMGFEVANHTMTHYHFNSSLSEPANFARIAGELIEVERRLMSERAPRTVTLGYPANDTCLEGLDLLKRLGYRFARRGMQPEVQSSVEKTTVGPTFDPSIHHPLLVPTTAVAYPEWTLEHFRKVVAAAQKGKAVVLQFHGVPDPPHPHVSVPAERFREYMQYLKEQGYTVIALKDLEKYVSGDYLKAPPEDDLCKQITARQ
jgi:peptidoglycan/xylan/chitin deacetylase (PgdA/CDA1 family)